MKKRIIAAILCVCALFGAISIPSATASAVQPGAVITPEWTNVNSIKLNMSFNNGTITSEGTVTGYSGTTYISVSFTLEKQESGQYKYVDSWTASSTTMLLGNSHSTPKCTAGIYRLSISGTAMRNGTAESFSDWLVKTF
jgi:hypothetical protein